MAGTIINPILPGFNPDPSFLRVGEDYYIATSTFEWFPGVQIHHSRDLVHWELIAHPLQRLSQLNMTGNINSGGIWAPCLSYDEGTYYLIYTDVKSRRGAFKDTHNYLVTAKDIRGPWSDPVYLNSSGFDPSLFHDEDGRKWLLNMLWDFRKGRNAFAGILLQEYSVEARQLIGPVYNIFKGTALGLTEGPHLYKRNGYYYLMTAEGGTQYEHAVTVARAKSITGPYETDPAGPMLTSKGHPELPLQKAGHGSLVETHTGEWYLAHLCGRPAAARYCILGRETALQRCGWTEDGWLRLADGGNAPSVEVQAPAIPAAPVKPIPEKDDFDESELSLHWNTLRLPPDPSWLSLTARTGYLRLSGRESMSSLHAQSLVARRQQSFHFEAETAVEFEPEHFQQMAGLILYYDTDDYVYLRLTHLEGVGKVLGIIQSIAGQYDELLDEEVVVEGNERCYLKAVVHRERLQFHYSLDGEAWKNVGPAIGIRHLSDDYADLIRFTGNFVGVCVQDLAGTRKHADFDYFRYKEL
ncbi:glycoside hydrolase family 43 protein [Xylanibacillus composti]|uniref:Beta-xylosidase n=1 Tax=Xylanibacillus composti TaxID=1572762 RepID=A0A8J4H6K9_9BACL|nr:glycoside hydrolase family 43 protein [Xylanibacillus composti]MDT9726174.1 glycoside hydrolase family 43 protein [Xylanibacillus composti]GIQ70591.1 beta-xylosidase [Xylanibacillus composti]